MKSRRRLAWCVLLLLFGAKTGHARNTPSQILRVLIDGDTAEISPKTTGTWKPDELVCVYHDNLEVGCGEIEKVQPNGEARVKFTRLMERLHEKDPVQAKAEYVERRTDIPVTSDRSLNPKIPTNVRLVKPFFHNVQVGATYGQDHGYVFGEYSIRVERDASVGIRAMSWMRTPHGADSFQAMGGMLVATTYFHRCFRGLYGQLGLGGYRIDVTGSGQSDSVFAATVQGSMGYIAVLADVITINLSAVGIFLDKPRSRVPYDFITSNLGFSLGLGLRL